MVIIGGGFTGIELATALRDRLAEHIGPERAERAVIVLVDRVADIPSSLGVNPRPVIEEALRDARVEMRPDMMVAKIDGTGLEFETGERLSAHTVIATTGMLASPLTGDLGGTRDSLGRLQVDDTLCVTGLATVFATGDVAHATVDDAGHVALMSCQHAMTMGRYAGHNAVMSLLGQPGLAYRQERYVTCLDLGRSGAVFTRGWARDVELTGHAAGAVKRQINQEIIYPPTGSKEEILEAASLVPAASPVTPRTSTKGAPSLTGNPKFALSVKRPV